MFQLTKSVCNQVKRYKTLRFTSLTMDKIIMNLSKPLYYQLEHEHAPFQEISKDTFLQVQTDYIKLRSLIYRTTDIELADGNSEVTFYSLAYLKRKGRTTYFASKAVFLVPPSQFLGDREEDMIIQWLKKDKALFFQEQRPTPDSREPSERPTLTPYEQSEIKECSRIFAQFEEDDPTWIDIEDGIDLPNFSIGFDFLNYSH